VGERGLDPLDRKGKKGGGKGASTLSTDGKKKERKGSQEKSYYTLNWGEGKKGGIALTHQF